MAKRCEVCERNESVGVASSVLGAFSLAFCSDCLEKKAEPFWAIRALVETCGFDLAEWAEELTTYYRGEYITMAQAKEIIKNETRAILEEQLESLV